jgi:hypothetical protein
MDQDSFIVRQFCGEADANFWLRRVRLIHPSQLQEWKDRHAAEGTPVLASSNGTDPATDEAAEPAEAPTTD